MFLYVITGALFAAGAAYVILDWASVKQKQIEGSLALARRYGGVSIRDTELNRDVGERVFAPAAAKLSELAAKVPGTARPEEIRKRLIAAGLGKTVTPTAWLAIKGSAAIGSGLFALFGGALGFLPPSQAFIGLFIIIPLMFLLPDTILGFKITGRRNAMLIQLPDVLDLLCVSVEAGLGFDGAVARICDRTEGPLTDELEIMLQGMRIGETRGQALKNFAERLDMQETTSFARSIIQADQLGMSLARILRSQSLDIRNKRQMAAEEKAMKAPIKMLFPTVLFIFPALFIVILGPVVISVGKLFG